MGKQGTTSVCRTRSSAEGDIQRIMDALRLVVQTLRVSARAAEKQLGISGAQLFVLQRLAEHGAQSVGELAAHTVTHQSSVSVVISRLAERGLVLRAIAKHDGRRVEVALTAAGRAILRRAPEAGQARVVDGLQRLRPEQQRALARQLTSLVHQMGLEGRIPTLFFEDGRARQKRLTAHPRIPSRAPFA